VRHLERAHAPYEASLPGGTYKAEASTVDFINDPEEARSQINAWVAQATSNLIGSVFGPRSITPLTRVVLGNAIYFKGKWERPFDKKRTTNKLFYRLDGGTVDDVPFMKSRSSQFIAVHDGFKVLKLRYQMAQAQGNPSGHTTCRSLPPIHSSHTLGGHPYFSNILITTLC
jgi:serpin B